MQIVVNHLTKMKEGYICAAGIDVSNATHIRPTLNRRLDDNMAARYGGPLAVGSIVDIGSAASVGVAPEVEDRLFSVADLKFVKNMAPVDFWSLLTAVSKPSLEEIFGEQLQQRGKSYAVVQGAGIASLGCLHLSEPPTLFVDAWGKLKMFFNNSGFTIRVNVNDLRMHHRDGSMSQEVVDAARAKIASGQDVIFSVGLSRAFLAQDDTEHRHWLQINNVHFADDPVWSTLRV